MSPQHGSASVSSHACACVVADLMMAAKHGGQNQQVYFHHSLVTSDLLVDAKLCGVHSNEPPNPPICDVLQVGGSSQAAVEKT